MDRQVQVIEYKPVPLPEMQVMASAIAASGMFGVKTADEALALMLLCQAEHIHPVMALRRYHIIDHKPAFRADALQGEFEREGAILWHVRDEKECSATFWRFKDDVRADSEKTVKRAMDRYKKLKAGQSADDLSWPNELTIIRTMTDAIEKGLAMAWSKDENKYVLKKNWKQSPRQMLHARCLTEGVRAINPGLVAGIYTEDEIRDVEPEGYDQCPSPNVTERNVREATTNAVVEAGGSVTQEQEREGTTTTTMEIPSNEYGPLVVTEDNYKERIAHIGKAGGRIIGRKVGELEPPVVKWMYEKWRESLTPSASEDDMRLKAAIEFAYVEIASKNLGSDGKNASPDNKPESESSASPAHTPKVGDKVDIGDPALTTGTVVSTDIGAKAAFINDLRERIDNMVLTEEQAVSYMAKYSVGEQTWKMLDDLPHAMLAYLCTPNGWQAFKYTYEKEAKPKVVDKPKSTRKRRK